MHIMTPDTENVQKPLYSSITHSSRIQLDHTQLTHTDLRKDMFCKTKFAKKSSQKTFAKKKTFAKQTFSNKTFELGARGVCISAPVSTLGCAHRSDACERCVHFSPGVETWKCTLRGRMREMCALQPRCRGVEMYTTSTHVGDVCTSAPVPTLGCAHRSDACDRCLQFSPGVETWKCTPHRRTWETCARQPRCRYVGAHTAGAYVGDVCTFSPGVEKDVCTSAPVPTLRCAHRSDACEICLHFSPGADT